MGMRSAISNSSSKTHKFFLLSNYTLLGAATSCIFLTLSLRLVPSSVGVLLILLHLLTIALSVSSCSSSSDLSAAVWHAAHMAATVLLAIFHGAVALLVFSGTADFLGKMKSYVREEDGAVILRMVGGLGVAIFCLEWVVLLLAFAMRFYVNVDSSSSSAKVVQEEDVRRKDWLPFQVV